MASRATRTTNRSRSPAAAPRRRPTLPSPGPGDDPTRAFRAWFAARGWEPFPFQEEVWRAAAAGESGLLHAPTGTGKTLAAWLGAVARSGTAARADAADDGTTTGPRVVWITPLRALAADTVRALAEPLRGKLAAARDWTVAPRTGDTSAADRRRLREHLSLIHI